MSSEPRGTDRPGGVVHSYLGYDPQQFPPPGAQGDGGMADAAFDHLLHYGTREPLTEEQLANAIKLDPSQISGFGPSIDALIAMLEERKRAILETYEVNSALTEAGNVFTDAFADVHEQSPPELQEQLEFLARMQSVPKLEELWYRVERQGGDMAGRIMRIIGSLTDRLQIEQLINRYTFTGRQSTTPEEALELKDELETIDRLLKELRRARETAQVGIIDMDALREFVDDADIQQLREMEDTIRSLIQQQAEAAGLEQTANGYQLGPKALRTVQGTLLDEIFSELQESRSGRHEGPVVGEGAVETQRTRPYEFGDSGAHLDLPQTLVNAAIRHQGENGPLRVHAEDIQIHETRNNPKAASALIMDMSGSMRSGGQYIACKKMALALDGLIRREYPGDHLSLIEMYSFAKLRHVSELPELMPKPVTIHDPWVRLRVDMADPNVSEMMVHPHFTNIQASLAMARRLLAGQDTPNRQIMLITDGLPTAHYEGDELFLLYPPDPLTEEATMREAQLCAREDITINIFLVPSWSQNSEDIAFAHRMAECTKGRVFFTGGDDLDRFVLWDYLQQKRRIIG